MGHANDDLIKQCEAARRDGNKEEWERLVAVIDQTQRECPHSAEDVHEATAAIQSGLTKPGDIVRWCRRCSKILAVNGVDPWTTKVGAS